MAEPRDRRAARVLLLADGAVLLIRGVDPAHPERGTWWHTPGGEIDPGESPAEAAAREVLEETGQVVAAGDVGPVVATRVAEFEFEGVAYRQSEQFFALHLPRFDPTGDGWDTVEQRSLLEHRWWTPDELDASADVRYPSELASLVRTTLAGPITTPIELRGD